MAKGYAIYRGSPKANEAEHNLRMGGKNNGRLE